MFSLSMMLNVEANLNLNLKPFYLFADLHIWEYKTDNKSDQVEKLYERFSDNID